MLPKIRINRAAFKVTHAPTMDREHRTTITDGINTAYADTPHRAWQILTTYQYAVRKTAGRSL